MNSGVLTARDRESDIKKLQGLVREETNDAVAVYCRVSSHEQKQKGDLGRQKLRVLEFCAKNKYRVEYVFEEVASGMSDSRPQLQRLFALVTGRKISRVVVEHKDRLTRFLFGVFSSFFESYGVTIEWCEDVLPKSYEAELVEDMLSLLASFSAKIYGKRSAARRKKNREESL
jgi:putative resolvase